jgi:hypothetical protein
LGFPEGGEGGFGLPAHGLFFGQQRAEKFRVPLSGEGLERREDGPCLIRTMAAIVNGVAMGVIVYQPFCDLFEGVSHVRHPSRKKRLRGRPFTTVRGRRTSTLNVTAHPQTTPVPSHERHASGMIELDDHTSTPMAL